MYNLDIDVMDYMLLKVMALALFQMLSLIQHVAFRFSIKPFGTLRIKPKLIMINPHLLDLNPTNKGLLYRDKSILYAPVTP